MAITASVNSIAVRWQLARAIPMFGAGMRNWHHYMPTVPPIPTALPPVVN